ncbi:MAG: NAD(P)/FAD-dependent oxidoreductase [Polyangiaceae bacterium]
MARSRLMHAFVRAARILRSAREHGIPATELAGIEAEARRLSRRQFAMGATYVGTLAATAGVGVGAAACSSSGGTGDGADASTKGTGNVIVVGGGIAGVHATYRLAKAGVDVTLYDAQKTLGGRIQTDRTTFPDGMHCEIGGELIDTGHTTMHALATEFGIPLYDYSKDDDDALESVVGFFDGELVTEATLLTEFAPVAAKIDEALKVLQVKDDGVSRENANGGAALDAMSIKQWLDAAAVSGRIRKLLEVAFVIEFGLDVEESNALNLLLMISTDTKKLALFGESDELFHTKTGNATFVEKLVAGIEPARIALEHELVALKKASDGRYTATFKSGASTKDVTATHVVLALPFSILRNVAVDVGLPAPQADAIQKLGYGANAKLMTGWKSRPWRTKVGTRNGSNGEVFTDLAFQSTWETSRAQPGASGIVTNFTGGKSAVALGTGTPETHRDAFVDQWDKVFPGSKAESNGKVVLANWPGHPFVKGSYSAYKVGQYTSICGVEGLRHENVLFCGEHTSSEAQGFMEGGAATGLAVAEELIAEWKGESPDAGSETKSVVLARAARIDRRALFGLRF